MTRFPLISIAMASYNNERFITDAIESICKQTYTNWELIIVDDCSTDKTYRIAKEYENKDNRIRVFRRSFNSGGPTLPRYEAIMKTSGNLLSWIDSDDVWEEKYLDKIYTRMQETDADLALGELHLYSEDLKTLKNIIPSDIEIRNKVFSGLKACTLTLPYWEISGSGFLIKTSIFKNYIKSVKKDNLGFFSDEIDTRKLFLLSKTVACCNAIYMYRQVSNTSVVHDTSIKSYNRLHVSHQLLDFTKNKIKSGKIFNKVANHMLFELYHKLVDFHSNKRNYNNQESKKIIDIIKSEFFFLKKNKIKPIGLKNKIIYSNYNIAHIAAFITACYTKLWR